jgi:hypothetical protein
MDPFHWLEDATVKIAATTAGTDRGALKKMPTGRVQIEIYNAGSVAVFIRKGTDATVTASSSNPDKPIGPGVTEVLTLINRPAAPVTHIAAVTASGTADVYITVGAGI